ncbi:MAG: hypothetical protein ACOC0H_05855 [Thermodesulfobacteriota bacterium]
MKQFRFPKEIRDLMKDALPEDTAVFGQTPDLKNTFTPAGHARALHPDAMLVVGIRGAGKSFWWAVLQDAEHRRMVANVMPKSGIKEGTRISTGFGERPSPVDYPGKDTLVQLCDRFEPRHVWRAIVLRKITKSGASGSPSTAKSWPEAVKWAQEHPEEVERTLYQADQELEKEGEHLILFDALDRTADDWPTMLKIIRGLLQVILEFRSYRRIRLKAFVRPDHLEDAKTADFPDASKVLSLKVELRWPRSDLYGLLWQYLGNEPGKGELFREGCQKILDLSWDRYEGVWTVPTKLKIDEEAQRNVFHAVTGLWMGRDRRRGFPYTWLPNHLGDAEGQVSPRSFLAAIRYAARDNPRSDYPYALYYESIKRGVQEASRIRVREMQEDYPWVDILMKPLSGLTVPCRFEEIIRRWEENNILDSLQKDIADAEVKLPPAHLGEGSEGVRNDLEALGVFERMRDDRVNMPDVYRVGYGLGRKGGVKAVARK